MLTLQEKALALIALTGINLAFAVFVGPYVVFSLIASLPLAVVVLSR